MTGSKTDINLNIQVRCSGSMCDKALMEMNDDMESSMDAEYKCPKCANKVVVEFMLRN